MEWSRHKDLNKGNSNGKWSQTDGFGGKWREIKERREKFSQSVFHCYSKLPETGNFIKKRSLFGSQFWWLKVLIGWPNPVSFQRGSPWLCHVMTRQHYGRNTWKQQVVGVMRQEARETDRQTERRRGQSCSFRTTFSQGNNETPKKYINPFCDQCLQ